MVRLFASLSLLCLGLGASAAATRSKTCTISPLGHGRDDTDQVLAAIEKCGHSGTTVLQEGQFNITRKMTWDLVDAQVDLHGTLNFVPDIQFWLNANNTYRVVFIQDQASWFVVTGSDFTVDAHNTGGIQGNGQPWWDYYTNHTRLDGDGRPLSLTVFNATRGTIANFHIQSPPFWCNAVANSVDVTYDGMVCNATNTNPAFFGQNIVPNTDGIDTYRSDRVNLLNWDVTCGDDCLAIKGNSTNLVARNITCRGGNGVAFGSLGQYVQFNDIVQNVVMDDIKLIRLNASIQPNMISAVYFKTWDGSVNGVPPDAGGGAGGFVTNVTISNVSSDRVDRPIHVYQTNDAISGDKPSTLKFSDLTFIDFTGTSTSNELVDVECSPAAPCPNITFKNIDIATAGGAAPRFICQNVINERGLPAPCNTTGEA